MIYLLDTCLNGTDSITDRIEKGVVKVIPCPSLQAYADQVEYFTKQTPQPGDRIVLDDFTSILATARGDFKHGDAPEANIMDASAKYFGDKQGMLGYQAASNITMRGLLNMRAVGWNLVVLSHEDEALDEVTMTTKRNIKANPEARDMLLARSSDVFRLVEKAEQETKTDAEGNTKVIFAKGDRLLLLRRTHETLAKFHVSLEKAPTLPDGIKSPTYGKLCTVLGKTPSMLVVYGLPGAGKTTFATS